MRIKPIRGLSTQTKPINVPNGQKYYEMDTGKTFMFDGSHNTWYPQDSRFVRADYYGLSTSTKPIDVPNGKTYWEMDTQKKFMFDGTHNAWILQPSHSSSGGDSSLPEVDSDDDGKVLGVVDGEWDKMEAVTNEGYRCEKGVYVSDYNVEFYVDESEFGLDGFIDDQTPMYEYTIPVTYIPKVKDICFCTIDENTYSGTIEDHSDNGNIVRVANITTNDGHNLDVAYVHDALGNDTVSAIYYPDEILGDAIGDHHTISNITVKSYTVSFESYFLKALSEEIIPMHGYQFNENISDPFADSFNSEYIWKHKESDEANVLRIYDNTNGYFLGATGYTWGLQINALPKVILGEGAEYDKEQPAIIFTYDGQEYKSCLYDLNLEIDNGYLYSDIKVDNYTSGKLTMLKNNQGVLCSFYITTSNPDILENSSVAQWSMAFTDPYYSFSSKFIENLKSAIE